MWSCLYASDIPNLNWEMIQQYTLRMILSTIRLQHQLDEVTGWQGSHTNEMLVLAIYEYAYKLYMNKSQMGYIDLEKKMPMLITILECLQIQVCSNILIFFTGQQEKKKVLFWICVTTLWSIPFVLPYYCCLTDAILLCYTELTLHYLTSYVRKLGNWPQEGKTARWSQTKQKATYGRKVN